MANSLALLQDKEHYPHFPGEEADTETSFRNQLQPHTAATPEAGGKPRRTQAMKANDFLIMQWSFRF